MSAIKKTFAIDLDMKQPLTNYEWRVVEGDTGNKLVVTLTDEGNPVDLTDARIVMLFSRGTSIAMQTNVYPDASISVSGTDNNIITVDLRNGSFAPGFVEAHMQISTKSDPDSEEYDVLVTTAKFNFRCDRALFSDEYIMSLDSYSVLNELIDEVQEIIHGQIQVDWAVNDPDDPKYIQNKPSAMVPTAHAYTHLTGGADAIAPQDIGAAAAQHAASHKTGGTDALTPADIGAMAANATPTPAAHASSHATGGTDALTPSAIGAIPATEKGTASGLATLDSDSKVTAKEASSTLVTVNSSRSLALTDAGKMLLIDSASSVTVSIPSGVFPLGTEIEVCRRGSGSAAVAAADAGVNILSVTNSGAIGDRYSVVALKYIESGTTEKWLVTGGLA